MASFPTDDTTFADLTLVFGGEQRETKKVHKFVLYHKSGFFKTMLNSEFKEGYSNTIELHDDDPVLLRAAIDACYGVAYKDIRAQYENEAGLLFDVRLFSVADKYDIMPLKNAVELEFNLLTANLNSDDLIKVVPALSHLYDMPDIVTEKLRKNLVKRLRYWLPRLLEASTFEALLAEHIQLATDLVVPFKRSAKDCVYRFEWECADCKQRIVVTGGASTVCKFCAGCGSSRSLRQTDRWLLDASIE